MFNIASFHADLSRLYNIKKAVKKHCNTVGQVAEMYSKLPSFLRDDVDLALAIASADTNSLALLRRVENWEIAKGDQGLDEFFEVIEGYLERCVKVAESLKEAARALRALMAEVQEGEEVEEGEDEDDEDEFV